MGGLYCPKDYGWMDWGEGRCPISGCTSCAICLKSRAVSIKAEFVKKAKGENEPPNV